MDKKLINELEKLDKEILVMLSYILLITFCSWNAEQLIKELTKLNQQ